MTKMPILTKSKYLTSLQCPKLLWTMFHDPGRIPPVDAAAQFIFDQGHAVGNLAKKLYPGGIDIPYDSFEESLKETRKLLRLRRPLFEAGVLAGDLYARVDILNPVTADAWDIIEVKSSTKVKDEHIPDAAFQKYCCMKNGISICKCFLMHINNGYEREGGLNVTEFFRLEDISDRVEGVVSSITAKVDEAFKVIKSKECSQPPIGEHCLRPYECPLREQCWSFLPQRNVFGLCRSGMKKKFDLFARGIHAIADIPDHVKLNEKQRIQKKCAADDRPYVSKKDVRAFLDSLEYPLYYLDFETFGPAVPPLDGTRPFQQIPFQFSLHVVPKEGAEAWHHSFLTDGGNDPRPLFLASLKKIIGTQGNVIVYNAAFEKGVLGELAKAFPEEEGWIDNVLRRIKDLLAPFRSFHYYHPDQNGSASLKCVLPALTGKSYEEMEISEGGEASRIFVERVFHRAPDDVRMQARQDLEDYCRLDTQAMIDIVGKLKELTA